MHAVADDRGRVCARDDLDWSTGCCNGVLDPDLAVGDRARVAQTLPVAGDANHVQPCSRCSGPRSFCCDSFADCVACCLQQGDPAFVGTVRSAKMAVAEGVAAQIEGTGKEAIVCNIIRTGSKP